MIDRLIYLSSDLCMLLLCAGLVTRNERTARLLSICAFILSVLIVWADIFTLTLP